MLCACRRSNHVLLSFGRCLGKITKRNIIPQVSKVRPDGTRVKINFYVYFEIDDDEVKALLLPEWYDGDEEGSLVLLEPVPPGVEEEVEGEC